MSQPIVNGQKKCTHCLLLKPVGEFQRAKTKVGIRSWCKRCMADYAHDRWLELDKPQQRAHNRAQRLKQFGLTQVQYDQLFQEQNGKCAICGYPERESVGGTPKRLSVDHNHQTDKVRALLCSRCNSAIGLMDEDPIRLGSAITYLEMHNG